jgi:ATP synthase I subunit
MTDLDLRRSLKRLYLLTAVFTAAGFVWYFAHSNPRDAYGFLIGAVGSFGNLWVFNWLSRSIAPGERKQKPWTASLFIGRYAGLWVVGYGTVKLLDVGPLPVLLGLLASTAAVLASSIVDLILSFAGSRTSN